MKKPFLLLLLIAGFSFSGFSQIKTYSFEEASKLAAGNPKPYFIFIKTDWCKFCKMMEKSTFQNQEIIAALNEGFYFIVLDAQSKQDITFSGKTFRYLPNGINSGIHELASELAVMDNGISYPTTVILNPNFEIISQKSGFMDSRLLLSMIQVLK